MTLAALRRPLLGLVALAGALAAAGCGSSAPAATVVGRAGALEVVDAYLPDPASPSVAAVYLTVRNTGSSPDALVSVASPAASSSMLMTEDERGASGTMAALRQVAIPAHGQVSLVPGHDHAMLEQPRAGLAVGQKVPVTLVFAHAGSVTVQVPVVPLSAVTGSSDGGSGTMGAMSGMSG